MNSRRYVVPASIVLALLCFSIAPLPAQQAEKKPAGGFPGSLVLVLEEFDGVKPNGKWDIHQYPGTFHYEVKPDALVMIDQKNRNQHLTRRGLRLDPKRRYAVEALFTINEPADAPAPNSFCLNFNIAGPEGSLESISCWSINVDVLPGDSPKGVTKHMGFVDGRFSEIGQTMLDWSLTNVEYLLRVEVNTDKNGEFKFKTLTVTIMEGDLERERFEVDYSSFPYQPDFSQPVRIGVNTHGADWTMRNLKVYADAQPTSDTRQSAKRLSRCCLGMRIGTRKEPGRSTG